MYKGRVLVRHLAYQPKVKNLSQNGFGFAITIWPRKAIDYTLFLGSAIIPMRILTNLHLALGEVT